MPAWFLMSQREGVLCLSVEKVRGERWLTYCNILLASALNPISSCKMLLWCTFNWNHAWDYRAGRYIEYWRYSSFVHSLVLFLFNHAHFLYSTISQIIYESQFLLFNNWYWTEVNISLLYISQFWLVLAILTFSQNC